MATTQKARDGDYPGYATMTMIVDDGPLPDIDVRQIDDSVAWVLRISSYPVNLSVHLSRAGLERLADRIDQALQDGDDDGADLDDKDTGPCEACGRLADRVPVRDNGRVFFACPGCAARDYGDTVDLDDPALTDGP